MYLERSVTETMIFGGGGDRRYTQDSPVLPDVWIHYGESPLAPLELLLTPHYRATAGTLARALRTRLEAERKRRPRAPGGDRRVPPGLAYTKATVAVTLYLDEVVRVLLPMTSWWQHHVWTIRNIAEGERTLPDMMRQEKQARARLVEALDDMRRASEAGTVDRSMGVSSHRVSLDLVWMIRIVGTLVWVQARAAEAAKASAAKASAMSTEQPLERPGSEAIVDALAKLVEDLEPPPEEARETLYLINRNRPVELAVNRSSLAVKADAARGLFNISCRDLTWAVLDSGIDATHPAFLEPGDKPELERSRVLATYDFSRVRVLLDPDNLTPTNPKLPETLRTLLAREDEKAADLKRDLKELRRLLLLGREIDWQLLEPFLRVPHDEDVYQTPSNDHGTHVAGILAGNWKDPEQELELVGMCPDLKLYDLRVLDPAGPNDEFAVLAALQFIQHLNNHQDFLVIHGANLSLSIRHDVANYACGRTPVCEECERLVAGGVVVVAAAGNAGHTKYMVAGGQTIEGYTTVSITDPGNAEAVITVGATHRDRPHTYGVSYFSSRGPTGDGRRKPDLVAPGEKITAPTPGGYSRRKDGTSMASPHVSGAAALLMARHSELIGNPARIKQVLCDTATDLGREPYFQGKGMLDVLRALQSI